MGLMRLVRQRVRPAAKSAQAVIRWRRLNFEEAPPVFGNAKPKSGSHLLLQILAGFTRIMPARYVAAEPIRTITKAGERRSARAILADLQRIPAGVIGWGYLEPSRENVDFLCRPGRVNYFIYRDPRDMLVSHVHFATDMHAEHGMHAHYMSLPDFDARLRVAITGIERAGLKMVSVRERYAGVIQWLQQEHVMCIRFEDLVQNQQTALAAMLDAVESAGYRIPIPRTKALAILTGAIQPKRSRTFRSGKAGGWRDHFTPAHKQLFLDVAGDLLVQLGYESDDTW